LAGNPLLNQLARNILTLIIGKRVTLSRAS